MIVFKFRLGSASGNLYAGGADAQAADARECARDHGTLPVGGTCQPVSVPELGGIHKARYKGNEMYQLDMGGTEEGYASGGMPR